MYNKTKKLSDSTSHFKAGVQQAVRESMPRMLSPSDRSARIIMGKELVCMEHKACSNCRNGEYYSDKCDIWCSLYEKWVGLPGDGCSKWEWVATGNRGSQEIPL